MWRPYWSRAYESLEVPGIQVVLDDPCILKVVKLEQVFTCGYFYFYENQILAWPIPERS